MSAPSDPLSEIHVHQPIDISSPSPHAPDHWSRDTHGGVRDLVNSTQPDPEDTRRRLAVQVTQTGIWEWCPQTNACYFSPEYAAQLGYQPHELKQDLSTWINLVHPDDRDRTLASAQKSAGLFEAEFRLRHRDGSWRWILSRGIAVAHDDQGNIVSMVGTHTDITERVQLMDELRRAHVAAQQASMAKDEFLANISHELRTPLTAVIGFADLLALSAGTTDESRQHLSVIRRSGEHLLSLINDLLDLSKLDAGKMSIELAPCDATQIARDVADALRTRAAERGTQIALNIDPHVPASINADPLRLRQILMNLVSNAVKFTSDGLITISLSCDRCSPTAAKLTMAVTDSGIGIAAEHLATLFERFRQADSSTTRRYGGTGLGLAITQHLVSLMQGKVEVTSREAPHPSHGTTFTVTIPTSILHAGALPAPTTVVPPAAGLPGIRILLAEDSPDNQRLLSMFVAKAGAQVTAVSDGEAAASAALDPAKTFDLILMDMQMPVLDGYGAVRRIRMQNRTIPIIALTANAMVGDREYCLALGCDRYVTKPVTRAVLIAACAELLAATAAKRPCQAA